MGWIKFRLLEANCAKVRRDLDANVTLRGILMAAHLHLWDGGQSVMETDRKSKDSL